MQLLEHSISVFMAFFAIMNPIANTAVFAGLAGEMERAGKSRVAARALLIAFAVVCLFSVLGKSIFDLFGITLPALRIAGGILVFLVGYHMLQGSSSRLHSGEDDEEVDIAVSPLAMPILAGPGTIATAMNYSAASGWMGIVTTVVSFLCLCLITFFCFRFSASIINRIGSNGLGIVTRLMGLILTVIGVQMFIVGAQEAFDFAAGS